MIEVQSQLERIRRSPHGAFEHLDPAAIASGLERRLAGPASIDQGSSSLCGPASVIYCLAHDAPAAYAQLVADLYLDGHAQLGDLAIRPGRGCRRFTPAPKFRIDPCDWVALASLKDSANHVFAYDSPRDQFPGITLPRHTSRWLRAAGYETVTAKTRLLRRGNRALLEEAAERHRAGERVCLLVDDRLFRERGGFRFGPWPNHWVVLTQADTLGSLAVFSWGRNHRAPVIPAGADPVQHILRNFNGFVAARYSAA